MSWEGYLQCFCTQGHFYETDPGDPSPCDFCGQPVAQSNLVDDTNCAEVGVITFDALRTLLIAEEKYETCNMGHQHLVEEARYRIPSDTELDSLRHYYYGGEYILLKEVTGGAQKTKR